MSGRRTGPGSVVGREDTVVGPRVLWAVESVSIGLVAAEDTSDGSCGGVTRAVLAVRTTAVPPTATARAARPKVLRSDGK
eukprot:3491275-Rhodomonas_salina.2